MALGLVISLLATVFAVAFTGGVLTAVGGVAFRRRHWRVEVGPSHNRGEIMQHTISAQLSHDGHIHHFVRVDMHKENWEEDLAAAVADMKLKRAALVAAQRIAEES